MGGVVFSASVADGAQLFQFVAFWPAVYSTSWQSVAEL
jgi:hypothetical protein